LQGKRKYEEKTVGDKKRERERERERERGVKEDGTPGVRPVCDAHAGGPRSLAAEAASVIVLLHLVVAVVVVVVIVTGGSGGAAIESATHTVLEP
jgi:hypothetical protein